jgi:hypothetical protein
VLVIYRIIQEPGLDAASTVKAGAPLAVIALGLLALACSRSLKHEEEGQAFRVVAAQPGEPAAE